MIIAILHIQKCRECLRRISEGIDLIKTDKTVYRAFVLMNRAMLLQQLRYGLNLREWKIKSDGSLEIEKSNILTFTIAKHGQAGQTRNRQAENTVDGIRFR